MLPWFKIFDKRYSIILFIIIRHLNVILIHYLFKKWVNSIFCIRYQFKLKYCIINYYIHGGGVITSRGHTGVCEAFKFDPRKGRANPSSWIKTHSPVSRNLSWRDSYDQNSSFIHSFFIWSRDLDECLPPCPFLAIFICLQKFIIHFSLFTLQYCCEKTSKSIQWLCKWS